jgi:hypothetical protein
MNPCNWVPGRAGGAGKTDSGEPAAIPAGQAAVEDHVLT